MKLETISKINKLIDDSKDSRDKVRHLVAVGRWSDAETDQTRKVKFILKKKLKNRVGGKESQIGDTLDWVEISFLTEGNVLKQAVGYVTVKTNTKSTTGTGFMISDKLFMTNNHVIPNELDAANAIVTFDKENDQFGIPLHTSTFSLNPEKSFITSNEDALDFSIIHLGEKLSGNLNAEDIGFFVLSDSPDKHIVGMNLNIIQHPLDLPKKVVFRNNTLVYRTDSALLYETDTETGSSGSPVLNDDWDLVAIHHWGGPYKAKLENPDSILPKYINEGIRISSIYRYLVNQIPLLGNNKKEFLSEALSYSKLNPSFPKKVPMSKKQPAESSNNILKHENSKQLKLNIMEYKNSKITIQIPLEITIGFANTAGEQPVSNSDINLLLKQSEANKIDRDYANRSGYDSGFINGVEIPLPEIERKQDIAPLISDESDYKNGILNYEHFSIVLNKEKRCAFFTATNIDGKTYKYINRKTGKVTEREEQNQEEGETWYNDDRIDSHYHLNQNFFSNWSHYFDRGHLTRRTDTSWGTPQEALRADADTFHFSNCSIQHFRFNQTLKYWQGLERYILENGVLNDGVYNKVTVIQGPIYDDKIDQWADDFQIPSKFFKIAVWKNKENQLKAVGLVADQSALLNEERRNLGKPKPVNSVNVNEWRSSIRDIEKLTNLKFGEALVSSDTISREDQPNVGEEGFVKTIINSWDDLLN